MADPTPPTRRAAGPGGPFILILMLSIVVGFLLGQATVGFLVGTIAGLAVAVLLWMRDRSR